MSERPPINDFILAAIVRARRKNLPSSVQLSQVWDIARVAGYGIVEYRVAIHWLLQQGVIFCFAATRDSSMKREQRIMPNSVSGFNFQTNEFGDYYRIRLLITADGLTNEAKRAMVNHQGGNAARQAAEILASFDKE